MIRQEQNQNGFSLIETVVATVVMMIVFVLLGSILIKIFRTSENLEQRAGQNKQGKIVGDVLRDDFEMLGSGLTLSNDESASGELRPRFGFAFGYQIDPNGDIHYASGFPTTYLRATTRWRGNGQFATVPIARSVGRGANPFGMRIEDADDPQEFREISISSRFVAVIENGETVYNTYDSPTAGFYRIKVERIIDNDQERCRIVYVGNDFNGNEQQFYQSTRPCLSKWIVPSISLPSATTLPASDYFIAGGEITSFDNSSPVRLPLLPMFRGNRLTSPLMQLSESEFTLISANSRTPAAYLTQSATLTTAQTTISLKLADSDTVTFQSGDVLFISDFWNNRSALLIVEAVDPATGQATVVPKISNDDSNDQFRDWTSDLADFENHLFASGTRIVKLNPPVYFRATKNDYDSFSLFRREGNSAWVTVVPLMRNFSLVQSPRTDENVWNLSYDIAGENSQTTASDDLQVRHTFAPRALNRTPEAY